MAPYSLQPLVAGSIWLINAPFMFLGCLKQIHNNALLIRAGGGLVVVNPPADDADLIAEVRELAEGENLTVSAIVSPGDWHHFYIMAWAKAFAGAKVYVASERNLRKQPGLVEFSPTVLDVDEPMVPELAEVCTIYPFRGCEQPTWWVGGDAAGSPRVEHIIVHNATATLFVVDHLFGFHDVLSPNKGGFRFPNVVKTRPDAEALVASGPKRLVFAHGSLERCVRGDGTAEGQASLAEQMRRAYAYYGVESPGKGKDGDTRL